MHKIEGPAPSVQRRLEYVDPTKFSKRKKIVVAALGILVGVNANLGSSLPSQATTAIARHFGQLDKAQQVLLESLYLLGYALGPPLFGPLSEHIGRRLVILVSFTGYTVVNICCAVSPLLGLLLFFRFLAGVAASAPTAVVTPLFADIYDEPRSRGKAIAWYLCICIAAPNFGPLISGYGSEHSWNLEFWIGSAIAGATLVLLIWLPETFVPVLKRRALRRARCTQAEKPGTSSARAKWQALYPDLKVSFSRPFVLLVKEPVVLFTSLYCGYAYALLFMFFQCYPIIFQGLYELNPAHTGLTFLPIAAGCFLSLPTFFLYSRYFERALQKGRNWAFIDEYRRLPLACVGGIFIIVSLFWLGWTAYVSIHPAVPAISGLLFGFGYLMIFMAMLNYLGDAYRQYSASANSAASTTRSLVAVCLPLATTRLFDTLGIHWACSVLAFLASLMAVIPFLLVTYGRKIRSNSPYAQAILAEQGPSAPVVAAATPEAPIGA